jgi:hypothetical protein
MPIKTNINQGTYQSNAPMYEHICKILWTKGKTPLILEKELQRIWPKGPKKTTYLSTHMTYQGLFL